LSSSCCTCKLFVELLGFGQHFLQALTIARGLDGSADVAGDQLKQLDIAVGQRTQETQFDDAIDPIVVAGWHNQHAAWQAFAEAGADLEIVDGTSSRRISRACCATWPTMPSSL
jgi:hypothetical protein